MEYRGILVGLGNPGPKYAGTRHNLGFALIDYILKEAEYDGRVESLAGAKFKCELWRCKLPKLQDLGWFLLAKPQTYMNLSGESVQPLLAWHKLKALDLVVLHDELDIPVGQLRFKTGGGNAGHNGLKSITQQLGTPDFHRLRLGIGRPTQPMADITGWVLGHAPNEEIVLYNECLQNSLKILEQFYTVDGKSATKLALSFKPK